MSTFGKYWKIGGLIAGPIMRYGNVNGCYSIIFERENGATLEGIEAIDWARPDIERLPACTKSETELPEGYGFTVEKVTYDSGCRSFTVMLQTARQYLGDVTGYQAQLEALRSDTIALEDMTMALRADKASLEQQLEEADEAAIALYDMYTALAAAVTPSGEEDAE